MAQTVGIDLIEVAEIRESVRAFRERYLARVYTPSERRCCANDPEFLATHFAAKEATIKALGAEQGLPWSSIELRTDDGRASVTLTGPARDLSRQRGIRGLLVDVRRGRDHCLAIVVADHG
jgi:holo-[acyl-carrier protein] synthase